LGRVMMTISPDEKPKRRRRKGGKQILDEINSGS